MDYFAEIAAAPDAMEAIMRLGGHPDAPVHLLQPPLKELHDKVPTIWRAELANWFYHKPRFAASVWEELQYCRMHRERVARVAVALVESHRRVAALGERATPEGREDLRNTVRAIPYLRAALVQAAATQHGHTIRPAEAGREEAVRKLARAMKPAVPLTQPREPAHTLMVELSEAAAINYDPPGFIAGLLRDVEAARRWTPTQLIGCRALVLRLARKHSVPVPFAFAHAEELSQMAHTREESDRAASYRQAAAAIPDPPCGCSPEIAAHPIADASPMRKALSQNLVGLAFSGGGIRSATFNLGVLQALAKLDVLRHCDYLSTVSGGGYIGSWLSAWIHRVGERVHDSSEPSANPANATLDEIRLCLSPNRSPNPLAPRIRPIRYLREFSNYLTPKTGVFSADTWTMAAIYIRNLILNLLVLIPLLAAALLVPRVIFHFTIFLHISRRHPLWIPAMVTVLLLLAAFTLFMNLRRASPPRNVSDLEERQQRNWNANEPVPWYSRQGWIQACVVLPLLAIAWLAATTYWLPLHGRRVPLTRTWILPLSYWCDHWNLASFSAILPHSGFAASVCATVTVAVIILFVFLTARSLASRWLKGMAAWGALAIAMIASATVAWLLVWSLAILRAKWTGPPNPQTLVPGFWSAVAAALIVMTCGAAVIQTIRRRRELVRSEPNWVSASILASAAGIVVAFLLWALGQVLDVLAPSSPFVRFLGRVWPAEALYAISLSTAVVLFAFLTVFAATRGFARCWPRPWRAFGSLLLALAGSGAAAFGIFWGVGLLLREFVDAQGLWYAVAFGTPLTLAAFSLVVVVQLGLLGINFPDEQREWWSRLRAWTLIYSAAWTALFVLAMFPPVWEGQLKRAASSWGGAGAVAVWLLSTAAGVKAGPKAVQAEKKSRETAAPNPASSRTVPKPMSGAALKTVATVAPYIFIFGLLALLSVILQRILEKTVDLSFPYWVWVTAYPNQLLAPAAGLLIVFSIVISWRIGVNEFSMHHFYKNRLVRCYLGASRWDERKADWFTGFDSADDIRLKKFDRSSRANSSYRYAGPFPIINAALNLVAGEDLAWQERKAASFTFTPKYCGYDVDRAVVTANKRQYWSDAYAPTCEYMFETLGPMLGTAMAISGAAANPNMGRITSSASAFLMTVFNVRLGWWLPNPRRKECWTTPTPRLGVTYGAVELFGLTDDKKQFVNISDGGHFENLGVYELIRRGCRYIIACDAGQDPSFCMEDLANLIRKCRTDFGVEIDIGIDRIREREQHGWSSAHCVVGTIRYPGVARHCRHGRVLMENGMPAAEEGLLIYLKPSITGDEPYDVLEYYKRVPEFPHESTADQWFNESQFESYRRLGLHIAETAFQRYRERDDESVFPPHMFERLRRYWYPPSPKVAEYSTEHTLEYSRILDLVRAGSKLKFLDPVLFKSIGKSGLGKNRRDEFYLCNALIQLIENVYVDLDLEQNYAHPHVGGWMEVFKQWAAQPAFQRTWRLSENTYAERFRNFYNDRLVNG